MRTSARTTGAVAAMAVAALLVSGCGGSSDDKGDSGGKGGKGSGKEKETPASPAPSDDKSGGGKKGSLPGVWQTAAGGEKLVLVVAGQKATLFRGKDEKKACTGTALGDPGTLTLKCPGGTHAERTNGTVEKVEAKSLTVSWNGGAKDDYTKVGEAPPFLPKDPEKLKKMVPAD